MDTCLRSSSMSILVNGSPSEEFRLERGVRQGDPLLPFLSILAAEGLNAMVTEAVEKGIFRGVVVGTNKVTVSHLQYADDTIFFGEWNKENAKSLMFNEEDMADIARWMECGIGEFPFTYLGLPIVIDSFGVRGLNIGSLRAKNMALLGKWRWGFKRDGGSLWVRVIKSIHGNSGGLGEVRAWGRVLGDGRDIRDKWRWVLGEDREFTFKELARLVEEKIPHVESGSHETLWNKLVPKKVNIFVWRALKGRLPVRVKLDKRGIDLDSVICPCFNNIVETCAHYLVTCDLAISVWEKSFQLVEGGDRQCFLY
ncbi:reverse transcriptase domain, reverse transcriptase zinc-binding domain protein [Tanacetum coccineum]|uniref:Reverse transcriptase domain, reverse transcriptase zinc-binding domain protein n=1 Tax=Tanacetum coccineum TaxID=301880 RepID=A0ABQ5DVH7_9ASTR